MDTIVWRWLNMEFTIRKLSEEAGVSVDTIRYYEREGLLFPKERNNANYRIYDHDSLERLNFIKNAKNLGFRLAEVKGLLTDRKSSDDSASVAHRLAEKLVEIKKDMFDLACKKHRLECLIDRYESANAEDISDFLNYLENLPDTSYEEISMQMHTYLYDVGQWKLKGSMRVDNNAPIELSGIVNVVHDDHLCRITRDFVLKDEEKTQFAIQFHIPIPSEIDLRQKFTADCSTFGCVAGSISFTGKDVFKHYQMVDAENEGYEHLKHVLPNVYEASGIISNKKRTLISWSYELEKVSHTM